MIMTVLRKYLVLLRTNYRDYLNRQKHVFVIEERKKLQVMLETIITVVLK